MGVDHRRADVPMPEEFLNRPDVEAVLQQVRGKGVAQGVARGGLGETGGANGTLYGPLEDGFVQVMTSATVGLAIVVEPRRRKDPLPSPLPRGARVLSLDCRR